MTDLRYPIGEFSYIREGTSADRAGWIDAIAAVPSRLRTAVTGLTERQLDTPYRPEGWTVRQVVHHVPDSHLNAYIRIKLALTEERPVIKPYEEARWAELADSTGPIEVSLRMLEALHERWTLLLRSLGPSDFTRTFYHPGSKLDFTIDRALAMYAWHGAHHVAHVTELAKREVWR
ncbi:MAG: YfiT family bacillithiol transferase [Gemmatimonadota bacterium]